MFKQFFVDKKVSDVLLIRFSHNKNNKSKNKDYVYYNAQY